MAADPCRKKEALRHEKIDFIFFSFGVTCNVRCCGGSGRLMFVYRSRSSLPFNPPVYLRGVVDVGQASQSSASGNPQGFRHDRIVSSIAGLTTRLERVSRTVVQYVACTVYRCPGRDSSSNFRRYTFAKSHNPGIMTLIIGASGHFSSFSPIGGDQFDALFGNKGNYG